MIDEKTKKAATKRLNIITGQIKGLEKMIIEEKYCLDILTQISAIQSSLKGVGSLVVRRHLESCVKDEINTSRKDLHFEELMRIIYKLT